MTTPTQLQIDRSFRDDAGVVIPRGVLDLATYGQLRDALLKSALEIPRAVIVDVSSLMVPTDATLAVFPSVWMQVSEWPGVPIMLVAGPELTRRRISHSPIIRYIPVYASVTEALDSLDAAPRRRRAVLELPYDPVSASAARRYVDVVCTQWRCPELIIDATMIASELVENAVQHAASESRLRLELRHHMFTVAVYDDNPAPVKLVEPWTGRPPRLGLMLVSRLANTWNYAPTMAGGKVVWAVLRRTRPEPVDVRGRRPRVVFER
jgi:anti-sigma regulatory factor (Ser/Thr protein kinase)